MKRIVFTTQYQKESIKLALSMITEQAPLFENQRAEAETLKKVLAQDQTSEIEVSATKGMKLGLDIALEGAIRAMARRIGEYDDKPENQRKNAQKELYSLLAQFTKTK